MTELQDAILDRLVGTQIGVNWPDGPLMIAAEVVGGSKPIQFGMTDNDRGAKSLIAQRLGYPVLLIEAIQGGNRALKEENDRRSFAMAVFQAIPPGGKLPKLSSIKQNQIAGRMAVRVHPYVCPATDCAVPRVLAEIMDASPAIRAMVTAAYKTRCLTTGKTISSGNYLWLTNRSDRYERLSQTVYQVIRGLENDRSMGGWCSIRESVRLAASERGMEEALECCVEVARECGLPVRT